MTTIVYANGILAADTRAYAGDPTPIGQKQKIRSMMDDEGRRVSWGVSTAHPGLSEEIAKWFANGKHADYEPILAGREFTALEIQPDGSVYYYHDNFTPSGPLYSEHFAIGTGAQYALGALAMGATPEQAVRVAMERDSWSGGSVQFITHIEPPAPAEEVEEAEVIEMPKKPAKKKARG